MMKEFAEFLSSLLGTPTNHAALLLQQLLELDDDDIDGISALFHKIDVKHASECKGCSRAVKTMIRATVDKLGVDPTAEQSEYHEKLLCVCAQRGVFEQYPHTLVAPHEVLTWEELNILEIIELMTAFGPLRSEYYGQKVLPKDDYFQAQELIETLQKGMWAIDQADQHNDKFEGLLISLAVASLKSRLSNMELGIDFDTLPPFNPDPDPEPTDNRDYRV